MQSACGFGAQEKVISFPELLRKTAGDAVFAAAVEREAEWHRERAELQAAIANLQGSNSEQHQVRYRHEDPPSGPSSCLPGGVLDLRHKCAAKPEEEVAFEVPVKQENHAQGSDGVRRPSGTSSSPACEPADLTDDNPPVSHSPSEARTRTNPRPSLLSAHLRSDRSNRMAESVCDTPAHVADTGQPELRMELQYLFNKARPHTPVLQPAGTNRLTQATSALWKERSEVQSRWLLRPDSRKRMLFDMLTVVALIHDGTVIPFVLAWDVEVGQSLQTLFLCSLLVWTVDIFMNFGTGYYRPDGEVEMRPRMVTSHYLKTYFVPDAVITGSDWLINMLEAVEFASNARWLSTARLARIARVGRVVRLVDLVRILRLYSRWISFGGAAMSNTWSVIFQALKILAMIVWINHLSSCVWFALGRGVKEGLLTADTGQTWLDQFVGGTGIQYADIGTTFQYTTSMHWSMTQMTPGSMGVVPRNSWERTWNIICLILGLLFGTSLVGQLSSKMVQFNMSRQVEIKRIEMLRRYLRENRVDSLLASRIQKQIVERMAVKTRLEEQDVEDIRHLSNNLRTELRHDTFMPHVIKHPLFSSWGLLEPNIAKSLSASGGVCFVCISPGHDLFTPDSTADKAFLALKGSMKYQVLHGQLESGRGTRAASILLDNSTTTSVFASHALTANVQARHMSGHLTGMPTHNSQASIQSNTNAYVRELESGNWLCEVALWMIWTHKGTLEAVSPCEFVSVDAKQLIAQLRLHSKALEITSQWCKAFHRLAHEVDDESAVDLPVRVELGAIIMCMPEDHRMMIGRCALNLMEGKEMKFFGKRKGFAELEEEVRLGKCALCIDGRGEFVRTVPVVALKLTRSKDEKLLYQLGKYRNESWAWEPAFDFPGTKAQIGEDVHAVARSVMELDLPHIADRITLGEVLASTETKESASYGVRSRYLKTVFAGRVQVEEGDHFPSNRSDVVNVPTGYCESDGILARLETEVLRDRKGKWLLYAWLSQVEFHMIKGGVAHDLVEEVSRWSFKPRHASGRLVSELGLSKIVNTVSRLSAHAPENGRLTISTRDSVMTRDPMIDVEGVGSPDESPHRAAEVDHRENSGLSHGQDDAHPNDMQDGLPGSKDIIFNA